MDDKNPLLWIAVGAFAFWIYTQLRRKPTERPTPTHAPQTTATQSPGACS